MSERSASTFRRATATEAEQRLMVLLNAASISYKWQYEIHRFGEFNGRGMEKSYIVDFLVWTQHWPGDLVVEVDGESHDNHNEYDATRDRYLEGRGYRVMHFTNRMVLHSGKEVIAAIQTELRRVKG